MVNNLGVDPEEWFRESIPLSEHPPNTSKYESGLPRNPNPLDSMPIATNRYHPDGEPPSWEDTAPCEYEPPHDEWFEQKKPEPKKKKEKTMHQKMYEIATARYNPFSLGGSENCDSDISCNFGGGSETIQK